MSGYVDKINLQGTDYKVQASVVNGTCESPQGNSFKDFVFSEDVPTVVPHMLIAIKFTYGNTYGDGVETWPVANINSQYQNIPICDPRGSMAKAGAWSNEDTVLFYFDGSNLLIATAAGSATRDSAKTLRRQTANAVARQQLPYYMDAATPNMYIRSNYVSTIFYVSDTYLLTGMPVSFGQYGTTYNIALDKMSDEGIHSTGFGVSYTLTESTGYSGTVLDNGDVVITIDSDIHVFRHDNYGVKQTYVSPETVTHAFNIGNTYYISTFSAESSMEGYHIYKTTNFTDWESVFYSGSNVPYTEVNRTTAFKRALGTVVFTYNVVVSSGVYAPAVFFLDTGETLIGTKLRSATSDMTTGIGLYTTPYMERAVRYNSIHEASTLVRCATDDVLLQLSRSSFTYDKFSTSVGDIYDIVQLYGFIVIFSEKGIFEANSGTIYTILSRTNLRYIEGVGTLYLYVGHKSTFIPGVPIYSDNVTEINIPGYHPYYAPDGGKLCNLIETSHGFIIQIYSDVSSGPCTTFIPYANLRSIILGRTGLLDGLDES